MKYLFLLSLLLLFSTSAYTEQTTLLQQAIDGNHRSTEHKNRDKYRHPQETLNFFEVEPDMTVVEIWPGGKGWYTEILAPYLKQKGTLYAAHFSANSEIPYFVKGLSAFKDKMKTLPAIYDKSKLTVLQPPAFLEIAPKGTADRVLTFRNVHNWMKNNQAENVFKAMHKALKSGGILGVVEHRIGVDNGQHSGYMTEATVISLAEKAGFTLLAKSEINANPKDTNNHPEGVWTLPPTLRLKDQDKDKYLAIGESDRMTLKFIKP